MDKFENKRATFHENFDVELESRRQAYIDFLDVFGAYGWEPWSAVQEPDRVTVFLKRRVE